MENREDVAWRGSKEMINRGLDYWMKAIENAGVKNQLLFFNDLLTGYEAPAGYGEPMVTDAVLGDVLCDIYHTDRDGGSGCRIFIHIKERVGN